VNPHTEIWEEFIKNVGPSLQHISFCGDYGIPLFVVKRLIESCPELDFIEGSTSKTCAIWSASEIPNLTKERAETVTFVNLYNERFDLNSIVSQCGQVRTFMFNWRHGKDLMLLDHENMKKLVDLDIVDRRNLNLDPSADTEEPDELVSYLVVVYFYFTTNIFSSVGIELNALNRTMVIFLFTIPLPLDHRAESYHDANQYIFYISNKFDSQKAYQAALLILLFLSTRIFGIIVCGT